MARPPLRSDIAAARTQANFYLGCRRELSRLEGSLDQGEKVKAMVQCRYQGCFGLAVITGTRLLFLCHGFIRKVSDDILLERIDLIQFRTVFGCGALTIHVAGSALEFRSVCGAGGRAVVQGLRQNLARRDRLDRWARTGVLSLAEQFAVEPATAPATAILPDEPEVGLRHEMAGAAGSWPR